MLKFILAFIMTISITSCNDIFNGSDLDFISELSNPNKTKKVILAQDFGNATVDLSFKVSIINFDSLLVAEETGNTFIVDNNHGATKFDSASIVFNWHSNDTLQIAFDKKLRVFTQNNIVKGVTIVYKLK